MKKHSDHVAEIAHGAFGKDASEEVKNAFYITLRGQGFRSAMRSLEVCLKEPGRKFPPTVGEILAQIRNEKRMVALSKRDEWARSKYNEGIQLTPRVFKQQLAEARAKYPDLFPENEAGMFDGLIRKLEGDFKEPVVTHDPWAQRAEEFF